MTNQTIHQDRDGDLARIIRETRGEIENPTIKKIIEEEFLDDNPRHK